jgi:Ca2+-binding RTX toxin-like protein
MGTYTGTSLADTITPTFISPGVTRDPAEDFPADAADTIFGNGGPDTLNSGGGSDFVYGGDGADNIYGKTEGLADANDADTLYGGNGNDIIYGNGGEVDTGSPDGNDTIYGEAGNDRLYGKLGNDVVNGGPGNDFVAGYHGTDTLRGESGNDVIRGGDGLDQLYGGGGNDTFDFDKISHSPTGVSLRDVVYTFAGIGDDPLIIDRIDLSTMDAIAGGADDPFAFMGTGAFTAAGQVRVSSAGTGALADTLIQVNTDADVAAAEMEILVKDGTVQPSQWVSGDFIL